MAGWVGRVSDRAAQPLKRAAAPGMDESLDLQERGWARARCGDAADADEDAQCDTMISSTDRRTSDGVAEGQHKMGLTWPELIGLCILWVVVLVYTL